MKLSIIVFDEFTDLDVFLPWDLLTRVSADLGWKVQLLGDDKEHRSKGGLVISTHGLIEEANFSDVVLFGSGPVAKLKCRDQKYLSRFKLDQKVQLIGSMCSGALILAALGLLDGKEATTYPTAVSELETFGVKVVPRPFVQSGNVATAAGCLAAIDLASWIIEEKAGSKVKEDVLKSIQPVGGY